MRKFISLLLLLALLLLGGCEPAPGSGLPEDLGEAPENTLPTLTTVVFSIGKADAILIHNEEHAILIDAGEVEDAVEVLAYLQKQKIDRLDALILTHYDKDHVGGATGVVNGIDIGEVYGTRVSKESDEYDLYTVALANKGLSATVVEEQLNLSFGDIHMTLYPPDAKEYDRNESNNSSLVIHMTYGETAYFFGGDAQEERVAELLKLGTALDCDFMKVPYHGNAIDNLPALLAITTPAYAVITCSDKNPEEPDKTAALRDINARVFLTRTGNVYATSDGVVLTVRH